MEQLAERYAALVAKRPELAASMNGVYVRSMRTEEGWEFSWAHPTSYMKVDDGFAAALIQQRLTEMLPRCHFVARSCCGGDKHYCVGQFGAQGHPEDIYADTALEALLAFYERESTQ